MVKLGSLYLLVHLIKCVLNLDVSGEAGDYDSEEEFGPLFDFSAPLTGFGLDFEEEEEDGQQRKGELIASLLE